MSWTSVRGHGGDVAEGFGHRSQIAGAEIEQIGVARDRFNLFMPGAMTVAEAHDLADRVEQSVFSELGITLSTHIEPATADDLSD